MRDEILRIVAQNIQIYGIKKMNLDLICKELKISKKTIYKYFENKDDMIRCYIKEVLDTDRESTINILKNSMDVSDKCHQIVYTYHKYKLPFIIMDEIRLDYEDEWNEIKELKKFKIEAICKVLDEAKKSGEVKKDMDLSIVALMIDQVSEKLMDKEILKSNNLKVNDVLDQVIKIILKGIMN